MDQRQIAAAKALARLLELIERSPDLLAVAKQSSAYETLKQCVDALNECAREYHTNVAQRPRLREQIRDRRKKLDFLAESVVATSELGRFRRTSSGGTLKMPARDANELTYALQLHVLAEHARKIEDDLVGSGMLPGRPDVLDEATTQFEKLLKQRDLTDEDIRGSRRAYPYFLEHARKTARVLLLQVQPFVTHEMIAAWHKATHLGRDERRALSAPKQLALPNPDAPSNTNDPDVIALEPAPQPLLPPANE